VILGAGRFDPLRATLVLGVRGGLTIPAELRRALAIEGGGELVAEATPQGLLLRPVYAFAVEESGCAQAPPTAPTRRHAKRRIH
jgi:bifunctional DNA-binding transcriptional regulator/antitoxin component of YhaV-PrlF toxin-antitoxin module